MKYNIVIFDLDGTLMDTSAGIIHAVDYLVDRFQLTPLTETEKRSFIGPPIQDSLRNQYHLTKERAWELATIWRNVYKGLFLLEAKPYEGIYDVLRFCREHGIKTGVATNKREDYTRILLDYFDFTKWFNCICGTDLTGKRTKVDLIRTCIAEAGVGTFNRCLMVGDTEGDFAAACKAGVQFLGVTYGFELNNALTQRIKLVGSCEEIINYLRR